ncbi:hypothetical protein NDA00_27780 [Funiculus sociatus GB2-M2]|uniref:hypothetical protein n=1 Tax=Cyanophyceae TaxID=3028117 RepID=UPI0018EFBD28|nr:hypothetical protein [Trichocoleus sp. FACHB-90]
MNKSITVMFYHHLFRHFYWVVTGLLLSLFISGLPFQTNELIGNRAVAVTSSASPVPTTPWQNTQLPDWNQITFSNLPGIEQSGSFEAPPEVADKLNYDPSRSWTAGQRPDQYAKLGDFQDGFKLQNFNLQTIASKTSLDLSAISLKDFGLMKLQTLDSLVKAIPTLPELPIQEVKPVLDLLSSQLNTDFNPNQTISQLLQQSPILGQLEFSTLPLEKYDLDAIPGLNSTSLGSFKDWQGININQIPGLSDVPFSQFPSPATSVGADVGIVDIAFATLEQQRSRTISGSDVEGFNVRCDKECAHVELSGNAQILGTQWVSGKYQQVRGGHGVLSSVNGGKEPTGRHPFGDAFKVVVWDISEPLGTMTQALFFRICIRSGLVDLGCTPYFIGPVPWLTYREMDPIFLGSVDVQPSSSVSTPTGVKDDLGSSTFQIQGNNTANSNLAFLRSSGAGDCKKQQQGVVLDAFSIAVSNIEGNYDSVGAYVCDRVGNCGRGLGTKQFMSYRPDVRSQILAKSGGKEFLARVDSGAPIGGQEMLIYFPPSEQKALFDSDATELLDRAGGQIDPTTGLPFTGDRLIQRVAQMHFGGSGIPIDASVSDTNGKLTVKTYGERAASNYQQALQELGC